MAETLTELLDQWRGIRVALLTLMHDDYGDESPQRNQIMMIMENQLTQCITELEYVLRDNPMRQMVTNSLVRNFKEIRDAESR